MATSALPMLKLALLSVAFVCVTSAAERCMSGHCATNKTIPPWDFLLFVNQWPESFCLYYNASHSHENKDNKCIIPTNVKNWTIHGTWPTKLGTEGPVSCNNTWTFDLSKIKDLVPALNDMWPDFLTGSLYSDFWAHEWTKHGTCAASLPALHGEHNYFGTSLKLKQRINIYSILGKGGIVPSLTAEYNYDDIMQAIKSSTGGISDLVCFQKTDNSEFKQYLAEIRLCLDKSFNSIDCPKSGLPVYNSAYYSPCSPKTTIALPPITH